MKIRLLYIFIPLVFIGLLGFSIFQHRSKKDTETAYYECASNLEECEQKVNDLEAENEELKSKVDEYLGIIKALQAYIILDQPFPYEDDLENLETEF